jgi:hypothetical protein
VIAKIFGKSIDLHGLYFASEEKEDVAVTLLPWRWLESYGIDTLVAPSVAQLPSSYQKTGMYIVFGYPSSINKLDRYWRGKNPTAQWFPSVPSSSKGVKTSMPSAQLYSYDSKEFLEKTPFALNGMSGGPILEILSRRIGSKNGLSIFPRAIICEHHKKSRAIAAAPIEVALKLIDDHSYRWKILADLHAKPFPSITIANRI